MSEIRRFLESSSEIAIPQPVAPGTQLLVVLDHHEAKVYRKVLKGPMPEFLEPYDPHGYGQHLHSRNEETAGKQQPEKKSYHEAIAATLQGADEILVFGSGTGKSSSMEQLLACLRENHQDVAKDIIGSQVIDGGHMTEGQLLSRARDFFVTKSA